MRQHATVRDLTQAEAEDLTFVSRSVYDTMTKLAAAFCRRHGLDNHEHAVRALLAINEAVAYAVIANNVEPGFHGEVMNSMTGGVSARLREYRKQQGKPVKYDA